MIICLGRPLPERLDATDPGVRTRRDTLLPLYAVLLQVGFTEPASSPRPLVRSYRTVSPLPAALARPLAVCSLLHFPWAHAPWVLPSTLPCGVRTFLTTTSLVTDWRVGCVACRCGVSDDTPRSSLLAALHSVTICVVARSPGRLGPQSFIQRFVDQSVRARVLLAWHRLEAHRLQSLQRGTRLGVERL